MCIERKALQVVSGPDRKKYGVVKLGGLPVKETLEVSIAGTTIKPYATDDVGNPLFTMSQVQVMNDIQKIAYALSDKKAPDDVVVKVQYESELLQVKRCTFNTQHWIRKNTNTYEDLCTLLLNRKKYMIANPKRHLTDLVLFGGYLLTADGALYKIDCYTYEQVISPCDRATEQEVKVTFKDGTYNGHLLPIVMTQENFIAKCKELDIRYEIHELPTLPHKDSKCYFCNEQITLEDFKNQQFDNYHGFAAHTDCIECNRVIGTTTDLIKPLLEQVFVPNTYTFNLVPRTVNHYKMYYAVHIKAGTFYVSCNGYGIELAFLDDFPSFPVLDIETFSGEAGEIQHVLGNATIRTELSAQDAITILKAINNLL